MAIQTSAEKTNKHQSKRGILNDLPPQCDDCLDLVRFISIYKRNQQLPSIKLSTENRDKSINTY